MTDFQPTPQTPEEVSDGLRDAFIQAKEDGVFDWGVTIHNPELVCRCDLFGQGQMVISFYNTESSPVPNRWIRFWTRVFFNSKWNFEND